MLIALNTIKDQRNIVHAQVAKNRGARRGEFWLELDHPSHGMREIPDPNGSPEAKAERQEQTRIAAKAEVLERAKVLAGIVRKNPGLGERALRAKINAAGEKWGREKFDAAKACLEDGAHGVRLVNRGPNPRQCAWYVEPLADDPREAAE